MAIKSELLSTFLAGCGAFIGGILRYVISSIIFHEDESFPYGTLICNILGAFLMGLISSFFNRNQNLNNHLRVFLTTGILGGFTTFSTFIDQSLSFLVQDKVGLFFANVLANLLGGFSLNALGTYIPILTNYRGPVAHADMVPDDERHLLENNISSDLHQHYYENDTSEETTYSDIDVGQSTTTAEISNGTSAYQQVIQ